MAGLPNGAAGLDQAAWLAAWVLQNNVASLAGRTQEEITAFFQNLVQQEESWLGAAETFFQGILGGFESLGTLLSLVVEALTGAPGALVELQAFAAQRWNDIATSLENFVALLQAAGQADIAALGTAISTAVGNAASALSKLGDIIINAGVADAAAVGAALATAGINASSALTKIAAVLTAAGASTEAALGTAVSTATSNISNIFTAFGGTLAGLQQFITNFLALFGVSLTTMSGTGFNPSTVLTNFINTLLIPLNLLAKQADLQTLFNNLYDGFLGSTGSTGKTLANVLTAAQTFFASVAGKALQSDLQTLYNNIFDGLSGTTGSVGKTLANVLSAAQAFYATVGGKALQSDVQTLYNNLVDGFNGTTGSAGKTLANVLSAAQSLYTSVAGKALQTDVQTLYNNLVDGFNGTVGSTGKTLANVLSAAQGFFTTVSGHGTSLQTLYNNLVDGLSGTTGSTGKTLANVLTAAQTFFTTVAGKALQSDLQTLQNNLYDAFNGTVGSTGKTLANVLAAGQALYTSLAGKALQTDLQTLLNNLFDAFNGSTGSTGKTLANVLSGLQTFYTSVWPLVANFQTLLNNIYDAFNGTTGSVGKTLANVFGSLQAIYSLISTINTALTQLGTLFSGGIVAVPINTAITQIKAWWSSVGGNLPGALTNVQGILDGVVNSVNATGGSLGTAVGSTLSAFSNAFSGFISQGVQYLQGVSAGIYGVADWALALLGIRTNTASNKTRVEQVAAALNTSGAGSGQDITVDFSQVANQTNLNSPVSLMTPGTGATGVTSGEAILQATNTSDPELFPTPTDSDYQVVEVTIGNIHDLASGAIGETIVLTRANTSKDTSVYLLLYNNNPHGMYAGLRYTVSGGIPGVLGTDASVSALSSGDVLKIILGNRAASNPYVMELMWKNAVIIGPYTDSAHSSHIGSGQRYVGINEISVISGKLPPGIAKIRYYDNAPDPGSRPFAKMPAPDPITPGRIYPCSDTGLWAIDNGYSWDRVDGGPLNAFTPPPPIASLTTTTLGTATITNDLDSLLITAPSASNALRAGYLSIPLNGGVPSPYVYSACIENMFPNANSSYGGILITDNTKFTMFGYGIDSSGNPILQVVNYSTATSSGSAVANAGIAGMGGTFPHFLRIVDDGANKDFQFCHNGVDWMSLYKTTRTTFLTATGYGIGAACQSGSANAGYVRCRSMKIA